MTATRIEPAAAVLGHIAVPGDKSISHRAVLFGAVADGETAIEGFGRSADTEATVAAVRALGVDVVEDGDDALRVRGAGLRGLRAPVEPIDCGNAGTLMRLLTGLLAGQSGAFELTGDESLSSRPMERVAEPLRLMGVTVETTGGRPPLHVAGGAVQPLEYRLPVASAQVKSAILVAGLYAPGRTTVVEPVPTRDHTELLLASAGVPVARRAQSVSVDGVERLVLGHVDVPGDPSSAAPLLVAAALLAESDVAVHGLGLNPLRAHFLDVLERMGARVAIYNRRRTGGEAVGDVEVRPAQLVATTVEEREVPALVDELPLLALAAGMAHGTTVFRGVGELRVKESDRLAATVELLRAIGVRATATDDALRVRGVPTRPRGGTVSAHGDHRLALVAGVAGLVSREGVVVEGAEATGVSFPGFWDLLEEIAQRG